MTELVVARYEEDLAWLRKVPVQIQVTVYDKSGTEAQWPEKAKKRATRIELPNVGREAHSYLHHIISNYEALSPITVFCQGHPFDHASDFHKTLRELASSQTKVRDFRWLGFIIDTDDCRGKRLFVGWSKNPNRKELPVDEFYRSLFEEENPETFRFYVGAQFVVTAEAIRRRSKAFYQRALQLVEEMELAPHCLERMWDRIFGAEGVEEAMLQGKPTAYLKPMKKLNA